MALNRNLFDPAFTYMLNGVGAWDNLDNCTLSVQLNHSVYNRFFKSPGMLPSLKVVAEFQGEVMVGTPEFEATPDEQYKVAIWLQGQKDGTGEMTIHFLDLLDNEISTSTEEVIYITDDWALNSVYGTAPPNTAKAYVTVKLEDALPNETWHITYPTAVVYSFQLREFLQDVIATYPDFVLEADRLQRVLTYDPFVRYTDIATNVLSEVNTDAIDFDYVRATDSVDGLPSNSSLTDPYKANPSWLGWLAQQVGVRLSVGGAGFTSWDSFLAAGIDEWVEWEQDIVSGGTGPDTYWAALENFDSGGSADVDGFRDQIASGFNGVMSSTAFSISNYITRLLLGDDPFIYIRKHYRTSPWRLAIVVTESADPDPTGSTLRDLTLSAVPAGSTYNVLKGVSRSSLFLYDAKDFFTAAADLPEAGFPLPADELEFIEDTMGTMRHLILYDDDHWYVGGGISRARYFGLVDPTGVVLDGHGLTSGFVQALSDPHADLDITSEIDISILVSDIKLPLTGEELVLAGQTGKWTLRIDENALLHFEWETGSGLETSVSALPVPFNLPSPYWLNVHLDPVGGDWEFFTAPSLYDDWESLGGGTGDPGLASSTAEVFVLDEWVSSGGTVYRLIIKEGTTTQFDLNLLDSGNTTVYTGATIVDEVGPNTLPVTITGDPTNSTGGPSEWVGLKLGADAPYFYLGVSPNLYDPGDPTDLGDFLSVSGLGNQDHNYTVTYTDSTSASANLGTATSHNLSSDDPNLGGKSIASISITNVSGGAEVALFTPTLIPNTETQEDDTYGSTWTITRTFESSFHYETSGTIDRDCWMPARGSGVTHYGGFGAGASFGSFSYQSQACSFLYRRDALHTEATFVSNAISTPYGKYGWELTADGPFLKATLWDGVINYELLWDEDDAGRKGEWNQAVLNLNSEGNSIELWVNGDLVQSTNGFFNNQWANFTGDIDSYIEIAHNSVLNVGTTYMALDVQLYADEYFDGGNSDAYKLIARKDGAWELSFNQQTGLVRFSFEDGGTKTLTTATEPGFVNGRPMWLRAEVADPDVFIYSSYDGIEWNLVDTDTGLGFPDFSTNPVRLGYDTGFQPYEGRIYQITLYDNPNALFGAAMELNFSDTVMWDVTSIEGTDQSGDLEVTLSQEATIEKLPNDSIFPEFYPIDISYHGGDPYFVAQLGIYDHSLDPNGIAGLLEEATAT